MHSEITDNTNDKIAASGRLDRLRRKLSVGLVFSVALHALGLSAFIIVLALAANPNDKSIVIPVDVVQLANETTGPLEPNKADLPQQPTAPPSSPAAKPVDISPAKERPVPDDLEIKLQKLAQLRQPIVDTRLSEKGEGLSRASTMRKEATLGPDAAIKDFLRDQIEHHWSLDLAILRGRNISVPIRVAITSAGLITKAEVVNSPELGIDPVYDEVAASARDAALLSSPLTLPPGHYASSMDLILSLNTRDALR